MADFLPMHERPGNAVPAAQRDYAQTGLMPELLSVYQLLGDPAMRIRQPTEIERSP